MDKNKVDSSNTGAQPPASQGAQASSDTGAVKADANVKGLFSSEGLTVETDTLPAELGGTSTEATNNSGKIASAFGHRRSGNNSAKVTEAFANTDASQGTNLPASRIESTLDADLKLSGSPKKKSKMPIIILAGLVVLAAIGGVTWLVQTLTDRSIDVNEFENVVGKPNLGFIFDESAPIPVRQGEKYGYIDAKDGKWLLGSTYESASNFYGDYAAISYTEGGVHYYAIIDKSGDRKLTREDEEINYLVEENVWVVGEDVYDSSLQKLNPDDTTAEYLGGGFIKLAIATDMDNYRYSIINAGGETIYNCSSTCFIEILTTSDGNKYASVRNWGSDAEFIDLSSGEALSAAPESNFEDTISNGGQYVVGSCEDSFLLQRNNGKVLLDCTIDDYVALPRYLYSIYQIEHNKDLLFIERENGTDLLDIANTTSLHNYGNVSVTVYDNSPFVSMFKLDDRTTEVCDILRDYSKCIAVDSDRIIDGYGNYLTVSFDNGSLDKIYNTKLELVYGKEDN